MENLIEKLKKQHIEILNILEDLRSSGLNSKKGFSLLSKSKDVFLEHLELEDQKLYPPLFEKAKTDQKLNRTLKIFASEMDKISNFVINFFEKYEKENENRKDFSQDITIFIVIFKDRIRKEEMAIYKSYKKNIKH